MDTIIENYLDKHSISEQTRRFLGEPHLMFIDGEFKDSTSGKKIDVFEPSTEGHLTSVPAGSASDINKAVKAAGSAFEIGEWSQFKPVQRQDMLLKIAALVEEHAQTLAEIESIDNGKAISGCLAVDIAGSVDLLRYMAGWATKIDGSTRTLSFPGDTFAYTLKEPVGVVGAIVPWNWPFSMSIWKLAAPLAVGCTVVLKPAEQTPLSILYFAKLCQQAGLPRGVINIVTGYGNEAGESLAAHSGINKLSFTGSTPIGKLVGSRALENMSRMTLELGGKSPMIVFEDADIDDVIEGVLNSVFFNAGQTCSAGSRMYIHHSIYEKVIEALRKAATSLKLLPGLDPHSNMGAIISKKQLDKISQYIEQGKKDGARLICGGNTITFNGKGYFFEPTIFADTNHSMSIVQEEIFGPVLTIQSFEQEEEVITLANDSIYGLAGSVFTKNISRALKIVKRIKSGTVCINSHDAGDVNMPFGGYKQSGFGKDMGPEQLEHFLETKSVIVKL